MSRRAIAALVTAAMLAAGVVGLNHRTAAGMTRCWQRYGQAIETLAQRHRVSQALVLAVVWWESGCNPEAARFERHVYCCWPTVRNEAREAERRFRASSYGLMQVLGVTARSMGYTGAPGEFKLRSLEYGIRYLAGKHAQWGSWTDALAAYNGGDGAVRRRRAGGRYPPRVEYYVRGVLSLRARYGEQITTAR